MARKQRPTFVYEPGMTYATEPTTLVDVEVGDFIQVEASAISPAYTSAVLRVAHDPYGLYFQVEYVEPDGDFGARTLRIIANTVVDRIRVVPTVLTVGTPVRYAGYMDREHGDYVVADVEPNGHYQLQDPHDHYHALAHVNRASLILPS